MIIYNQSDIYEFLEVINYIYIYKTSRNEYISYQFP